MFKWLTSVLLTTTMVFAFVLVGGLPLTNSVGDHASRPALAAPLAAKTIEARIPAPIPCLLPQWHFIINQLDDPSHAPASIGVNWSDPPGGSTTVQLTSVNNKVASYWVDAPAPGAYPVSASTSIYNDWSGNFVLSLACPGSTTTTSSGTSSTTTAITSTATTTTATTGSTTTTGTTAGTTSTTASTTTSAGTTSTTAATTTTATTTAAATTTSAATTTATTTTAATTAATTTTAAGTTATTATAVTTAPVATTATTAATVAAVTAQAVTSAAPVIPVIVVTPTPAAPAPAAVVETATTTVAGAAVALPRAGGSPLLPATLVGLGLGLSALGALMRRLAH